jgi:CRP/FNR family transcriptional regulator, anaerobic regulatory protein
VAGVALALACVAELSMKFSPVAVGPKQQSCSDCSIRRLSICALLDQDEVREIGDLVRHVRFAACETVFAQEDVATSFCSVFEGVLRLYKLLPDGRRQIVGFALPGDFLGTSTAGRHGFSADAIGPVTVCQFNRAAFALFSGHKPNLLRRLNELTVRELNQARDHMVLLGRRSAEEKVATFLVDWRDRLARLGEVAATVPLPMSRQDIADYLGLTIETVSRTLAGVIEIVPRGIRLLDSARAEALAAA